LEKEMHEQQGISSKSTIFKNPKKKRRKEGLACNLYSHQVGAISIAEEEMTARWAIKMVDFFLICRFDVKKFKRMENRRPKKSRPKTSFSFDEDDGNSKFVFGWNPNRGTGLLSNHFLDFGVDFFRCVALNNGWKKPKHSAPNISILNNFKNEYAYR
jgi:hypothetical protein